MRNLGVFVYICLALFLTQGAMAQNQMSANQASLISSVSPDELVNVLQSGQFNAQYLEEDNGTHIVELNNNGAIVYFALRECTGAGAQARCGVLQPFGFFNASGVTFGQINEYNLNRSRFSYAGLMNDGRGVVATKVYLQAGVSELHLVFSLGLYFLDLDTLLTAIQPGAIAGVSFQDRGENEQSANTSNLPVGAHLEPHRALQGPQERQSFAPRAPENGVSAPAPSGLCEA